MEAVQLGPHGQHGTVKGSGACSWSRRCSCLPWLPGEPIRAVYAALWTSWTAWHCEGFNLRRYNCIEAWMQTCCAIMGLIKTRSVDHRRMAVSIQKDSNDSTAPAFKTWTSWTAWHCEGFWCFLKKTKRKETRVPVRASSVGATHEQKDLLDEKKREGERSFLQTGR